MGDVVFLSRMDRRKIAVSWLQFPTKRSNGMESIGTFDFCLIILQNWEDIHGSGPIAMNPNSPDKKICIGQIADRVMFI